MKDDPQLQASLDFIRANTPKHGTKFNEGQPGGTFTFLWPHVFEDTLKACGLFVSEETHIHWILPLPTPTDAFKAPGQGAPVIRNWTDFLLKKDTPRSGDVYGHYKGGRYKITAVALAVGHMEFKVDFVICYEGLDNGNKGMRWVREAGNFSEKITIPRFSRIEG